MAKFYVQDGYERAVVDAESPTHAAVKAILYHFTSFIINGFYAVSERGFDAHDDDDDFLVDSNLILDMLGDEFQKKPKKDEDDY